MFWLVVVYNYYFDNFDCNVYLGTHLVLLGHHSHNLDLCCYSIRNFLLPPHLSWYWLSYLLLLLFQLLLFVYGWLGFLVRLLNYSGLPVPWPPHTLAFLQLYLLFCLPSFPVAMFSCVLCSFLKCHHMLLDSFQIYIMVYLFLLHLYTSLYGYLECVSLCL